MTAMFFICCYVALKLWQGQKEAVGVEVRCFGKSAPYVERKEHCMFIIYINSNVLHVKNILIVIIWLGNVIRLMPHNTKINSVSMLLTVINNKKLNKMLTTEQAKEFIINTHPDPDNIYVTYRDIFCNSQIAVKERDLYSLMQQFANHCIEEYKDSIKDMINTNYIENKIKILQAYDEKNMLSDSNRNKLNQYKKIVIYFKSL